MMVSPDGGVEIEKVAEETPERIFKECIHPGCRAERRIRPESWRSRSGSRGRRSGQAGKLMTAVYDTFKATDASLIEINPLIVTEDGNLLALDAKMNFDDNALYRHPDIKELRDIAEEEPLEVEASKFSLNYIKLDGTIGCMVNGAGLAMATMDIIKLAGRRAGELPRRWRRRQRRADQERVPDPDVRQERQGRADQYLRRHPALRRSRRRGHRGGHGSRRAGADRHPHGRDERREGQADASRQRPELHHRRHNVRSRRRASSRSR